MSAPAHELESYAGRSAPEIESQIERTREALDQTLEELQWRLSPRARLHAAADSARQAAITAARSSPVLTAVAAVAVLAVGWMLFRPVGHSARGSLDF